MKPCVICGAPFEPGSNRAKVCSPTCRRALRRRSQHQRTHPGHDYAALDDFLARNRAEMAAHFNRETA